MKTGDFVEISIKSGPILGIVVKVEHSNVRVLINDNQELSVNTRKIQRIYAADGAADLARLERFEQQRNSFLDRIDLAEIWELLSEEGVTKLTLSEIADWGLGEATPAALAAAARATTTNTMYFKARKDGYELNPPRTVQEKRRQLAALQKTQREIDEIRSELTAAAIADKPIQESDFGDLTRVALQAIKDAAINQQTSPTYKRAVAVTDELDITFKARSGDVFLDLMIELGLWDSDIQLGVLRHQIEQEFSAEVLESAEQLVDRDAELRHDFTEPLCIAIDDAGTTEIDDAVSLLVTPSGLQLQVFIADPAAFIPAHSVVDLCARDRASTLYMPHRKIPMLPSSLSSDKASLLPHKIRPALGFFFDLDEHNNLRNFEIKSCNIRVDQHLGYGEADEMLRSTSGPTGHLLRELDRITTICETRRRESGGINFPRHEVRLTVDQDKAISMSSINIESPSRRIISELMIWVGHETARFCSSKGIPSVFRCQTLHDAAAVQELLQDSTPSNRFRALRYMPRAALKLSPARHDSLGIDCYLQASSPLRRYLDLAVHHQLRAFSFGKQLPFSEEQLTLIARQIEFNQDSVNRAERESKRYWLLKYLEDKKGVCTEGIILDNIAGSNRYKVQIPEWAIIETLKLADHPGLNQKIKLKLTKAHARLDRLSLLPT